jgi:hypothetical protein
MQGKQVWMRFKMAFERKNGKLIQISINFRDNIDEVNSHEKPGEIKE